jgi:biopolymer transport protein ExbD
MRMRRHAAEAHESHTGIDLAPMLDFVTNLLIFFIITAVFVKEFGLDVNRPQGQIEQTKSDDTSSIPISILKGGEIWIDNREVDIRAVRANIERLHAVKPKAGVMIVAEPAAETGILVQVVDEIHLGGVENITFSTSS